MKEHKLILDVTQLVHWPGKLTGIPRVMNELAMRYARDGDCVFVVWSRDEQKMYQIDINRSLEKRGQEIAYISNSNVSSEDVNDLRPRLSAYRKHAAKVARKLERAGVPLIGRIRSKASVRIKANYLEVAPRPGDTLFVLWGEQHDELYRNKIKEFGNSGVKLVQISYDMLPLVTPQYSGHSTQSMYEYSKTVFPITSLLLAISRHTERDIKSWLKSMDLNEPRTEVFRLGEDFHMSQPQKPADSVFTESGLKGQDYVLCVGTIEARKNHALLYYTYKLAAQRGDKLPPLVIVGRRGWLTENIYELMTNDPDTKDCFIILENVSDEELSWLYRNCLFNIYPSFYEGWGLPIAESIAYGAPTISSNTSSMPEIAGDLIDYFSPVSTDECLAAIKRLMTPVGLKRAKDSISKYKPTSWDETFEQVDRYVRSIQ